MSGVVERLAQTLRGDILVGAVRHHQQLYQHHLSVLPPAADGSVVSTGGGHMDPYEAGEEMRGGQAEFRQLIATASADDLHCTISGTRWTNRQLLFHTVPGYGVEHPGSWSPDQHNNPDNVAAYAPLAGDL